MTTNEKLELLVSKALTRKEKNVYSQDVNKRTRIESGFGDCSGTVWYWYKKIFGVNIGANTEAQINSPILKRLSIPISNGVPDIKKLQKGDLLYFRGSDNSRTEGVGHVEMYIGNNQTLGHGSGIGATVKNMTVYCSTRFSQPSTKKLKNKGLICIKRFIEKEENPMNELTEINDIVADLKLRNIITDTDLWLEKLKNDTNSYWLARKTLHYIREKEKN